ncbi:autophagy- protein 2 [Pseudocyphellaria aurata]|nr:autophagy- protein 2 [Pseudocyphellaria aurata]
MTYFLPSFFQKRILRYVLSRLELLDANDLGLDKLDIAWGKRSSVELRDVGIHLKKLASLIKLPPSLVLLKARISLLRLTIPADLYKSGILIEVEGVDVQLKTSLTERKNGKDAHSAQLQDTQLRRQNQKLSRGVKADRPRNTQSLIHDPGGLPSSLSDTDSDNTSDSASEKDESSGQLPTTADLAQSFLQAEPQREKEGLEAAIVQSRSLEESSYFSGPGDETSSLGVGNTLSLPAFLTDFLKGVGDRLQLKVRNVRLDLDLDLDILSGPARENIAMEESEAVTIRLSVGNINLQGITNLGSEADQSFCQIDIKSDTLNRSSQPLRQASRRVSMDDIEVMLVSDASLFANLSRLVTPTSPVATHATSPRRPDSRQLASTSQSTSTVSSEPHESMPSATRHTVKLPVAMSPKLPASSVTSDGERFADAEHEDEIGEALGKVYCSSLGESRYQDSVLADSFYANLEEDDRTSDPQEYRVANFQPAIAKYRDAGSHRFTKTRDDSIQAALGDFEKFQLDPNVPSPFLTFPTCEVDPFDTFNGVNKGHGLTEKSAGLDRSTQPGRSPATLMSADFERDSVSHISDDLTESKIYSHEEAESMYMSAISHASSQRRDEGPSIQGGVGSSRLDVERPASDCVFFSQDDDQDTNINPNSIQKLSQKLTGIPVFGGFLSPRSSEDSVAIKMAPVPTSDSSTSSPKIQNKSIRGSGILPTGDSLSQGSQNSTRSENPLIITKKFVSIDSININLPQKTTSAKATSDTPELGPARKETLSSLVATGPLRSTSPGIVVENSSHEVPKENLRKNHTNKRHEEPLTEPALVKIGNMEIHGDVGLTKLTILIIQQYSEVLNPRIVDETDSRNSKSYLSHIKLSVDNVSWKFLDLVKGLTSSMNKAQDLAPERMPFRTNAEVLLKATLDNFDLNFQRDEFLTKTVLSFGKISFGYLGEHIISFDSGLKMRESTRDILAPIDKDLILTITQTSGSAKIDLTTLPLHIALDLRRLEETFSWFGGFSSILGLGSSMMSTVTIVNAKPGPSRLLKPSRGVHFETLSSNRTSQESQNPSHKITARIGGLAVYLHGANCTLRLESTAMKVVSRAEGIGLQVDRLKIAGPHPRQAVEEPSITTNLTNIRMEYLSTPKEVDLARLLALLSPSKVKYERDDDILLDTLLRQRRQGGVVRVTVEALESRISELEHLRLLPDMAEELKRLSTVTKYLPEDDRPGILTLGLVRNLRCDATVNASFGIVSFASENLEIAHVTLPSLTAVGINSVAIHRNHEEELLGETLPHEHEHETISPMVMARFIGNEMEPIVKVKIQNLRFEYHVSTIMALMGLSEDTTTETIVSGLVSSIATLTNRQQVERLIPKLSSQASSGSEKSASGSKPIRLEVSIRDSVVGLNPRNSPARGLVVLTNAQLNGTLSKEDETHAIFEVKKASLMIVDNQKNIVWGTKPTRATIQKNQSDQLQHLLDAGFVSVSYISSAKITLKVVNVGSDGSKCHDIEIRDDLFVLESCADSTQTLIAILNGLKPPVPPSTELRYRTEVVPVEDMLASLSGDAFAAPQGSNRGDYISPLDLDEGDMVDDDVPQNLEFVSSFYNPDPGDFQEGSASSMLADELDTLASPPATREIGDKIFLESSQEQHQVAPANASLEFREDHFGTSSSVGGTAHRWDTRQNTYNLTNEIKISESPLRLRIRDVHLIWNLFDGYDWQYTRDTISKAIAEVEIKAADRFLRQDRRNTFEADMEEESVIGDFLFNSIYIGIPGNRDPKELARQVNRNLDELASETESYATTSASGSPNRQGHIPRAKGKRLRLTRSKYHKMTFELKGVSADLVVFPPDTEETQNSIDIRVQDLEIFDHVPTSTWKKFATYMHDAGEREVGTSMIHLEILNVKPVPNLVASEIILKATILPLRLHVDQDALDFMTRFFEFKDDSKPLQASKSDTAFLQRVEINSVRLKLDFKPKRVDYAGLRSGRTNEFMNFFILDRADMVLRHVIIYGVSGFEKLGKTLNDIWMPDIKQNQLPGVLAGLAPVRSLVNVGGGVRDLVVVPIREYRKDGRVVRSFQKGALAFAKTTTSELVKLGAKLAIGTQTVLQGAEDFLSQSGQQRLDVSAGWEDAELEDEEKKRISLYADQPVGVVQGLRGAYASLERDLLTARHAIVAMPGEVMESGTASGAARAVLRGAPTVILRPAMGVTKAVGQTLMGATNSLDPGNRRRIEDKYKRH